LKDVWVEISMSIDCTFCQTCQLFFISVRSISYILLTYKVICLTAFKPFDSFKLTLKLFICYEVLNLYKLLQSVNFASVSTWFNRIVLKGVVLVSQHLLQGYISKMYCCSSDPCCCCIVTGGAPNLPKLSKV
jgi:hypothetical protein